MKPRLLVALLLAGGADEQRLNRFDDPFEALSADIAGCSEPRGLAGCVERAAQAGQLEALARGLPDVQQAVA